MASTRLIRRPMTIPESSIFSMRVDGKEHSFTLLKNKQDLAPTEAPTRFDREDPLAG